MREAGAALAARDVQVIGVATRADYQAQDLIDKGMPFPLLLDPDDAVRSLLGAATKFSALRLLHPAGVVAYWRAARQAGDFGPIWSEALQRPGVLILDRELNVAWSRFGRQLGDYPSVVEVLGAVDSLGST